MGLRGALAAQADVPTFVVVGAGGRRLAEGLEGRPSVRVVDSPRAATVLLVVGRLTRALLRPVLAVHDQLPGPRATVWWPVGEGGADLVRALPDLVVGAAGDEAGLQRVHADLALGRRPSGPPAMLDIEPAQWRGIGPYGTGGSGMTGGVPYGRPLPGRAADRDGLELDQLPLRVGPLLPSLPPGLALTLQVQGDVVRSAEVGSNPYRSWPGDPPPGPLDTREFLEATRAAVQVRELELARARHHLRWTARALRLHGMVALAARAAGLAERLDLDDAGAVTDLHRRLRRNRSLRSATTGVGGLPVGALPPGLLRRAAGVAEDARSTDPAYAGLDFEPVVHDRGDAWSRLGQRLGEAVQAVELAKRAGSRRRDPGGALEGPRGELRAGQQLPSAQLVALVPTLVAELEWADAMVAVASLDLDVEEAVAIPAEAAAA